MPLRVLRGPIFVEAWELATGAEHRSRGHVPLQFSVPLRAPEPALSEAKSVLRGPILFAEYGYLAEGQV